MKLSVRNVRMITNTMRMIINKRYTMKKVFFFLTVGVVMMMMGCGGQKNADNNADADSVEVMETPDSTVYGVCGSGTSMHSLELVTDEGDTITYMLDADDAEMTVKGGMLVGDRMAVVGFKNSDGEMQASHRKAEQWHRQSKPKAILGRRGRYAIASSFSIVTPLALMFWEPTAYISRIIRASTPSSANL